jgi:hypothetical protein
MLYPKNIFKNTSKIDFHYKKYKNILNFQNNYNIIFLKSFFYPIMRLAIIFSVFNFWDLVGLKICIVIMNKILKFNIISNIPAIFRR